MCTAFWLQVKIYNFEFGSVFLVAFAKGHWQQVSGILPVQD